MKWIGISGSWRIEAPGIADDVRREVRAVIERGDGIVTGGALSVDFIATKTALAADYTGKSVKVILPTSLSDYIAHYRQRASEGVITGARAEALIAQLQQVKACGSLVENPTHSIVDQTTYYLRNLEVVKASDELLAFIVNGSAGVQDTIDKAREAGKVVTVFAYSVESK
jgi:hypothetical protein